jgi:hypothetical protein
MGSEHVGNGSVTSGGVMHRETAGMSSDAARDNPIGSPGRAQLKKGGHRCP